MSKKSKKRKPQMPPLSFVDKVIYGLIMLVLVGAYIGLLLGTFALRNQIAFREEMVVAVEENGSMLWLLVPWMTFFLMTFILWLLAAQGKKPIFGLRNFQYGPPKWRKEYPLFMKNKPPVYVSERKKKERRQIAILLLVVLLVSFIPYPWSLYGRDCLYSNGSIVQYNMFNGAQWEFASGEIASVEVEAYRYTTGRYATKRHWGVRMTFTTDSGRKYTFNHTMFRTDRPADAPYWLTAMLQVKGRYDPGIITYSGVTDLQAVVTDRKLTGQQIELLYQLFGRSQYHGG